MSVKKQLIKSFMGVGAMKVLSIPIGLATSIILARTLGPQGFGQYAFIMALVPMISLPVSGGLPQLLTREIAIFFHSKRWSLYKGALRASHVWVALVTVTILLIYWLLAGLELAPTEGKWGLLPTALLMIPLVGLSAVRTGTIKGLGLPAYAELPGQLIQPAVILILFATLAWRGALNTETAIWGQVAGAGFIFLLASWMFFTIQPSEAKHHEPVYNCRHWGSALLPFSMIALVGAFNAQIGIIILGILSSDEQVAAMRVAERGGQFVVMSLTLSNMVIAPYIVRAHREENKALLQSLARNSARGSFFLAFPVAALLVIGGEPLIGLVFGQEYAHLSYWPLVILAVGQLFNVFFGSVGYFLSMTGHQNDTLKGQALSVFANILLCVVLVPKYGALGAAWSVFLSLIIWNCVLSYLTVKRLGIKCSVL